jgi:hypothetical protein
MALNRPTILIIGPLTVNSDARALGQQSLALDSGGGYKIGAARQPERQQGKGCSMRHRRDLVLLAVLAMVIPSALAAPVTLWWEAEDAADHNFPDRSPYSPATLDADRLSGGNWLSASGNRYGEALYAEYRVEVPRAGVYSFWTRKFWYYGPFRWRFDDAPWKHCGETIGLADSVELRRLVPANWVWLGRVELPAGIHRLRIETTDAVAQVVDDKAIPPVSRETVESAPAEWCTITMPKRVAFGQRVPVTVSYRGIEKPTRLCCDMGWVHDNKEWGGYLVSGAPIPEVQGSGTHTFEMEVKRKTDGMASVLCTVYLSDEGRWASRTRSAQSVAVPVGIGTTQPGASPACFDCFLLTDGLFVPRGKLRPGEKSGAREEGWLPFEPDVDTFQNSALLDLRTMNHTRCGEKGYLRTRGADLVFEGAPDTPVKFWGSCVGSGVVLQDPSTVDHFARRLAKLGINMVRLHGKLHGGDEKDPLAISDDYLDHLNYFVAALGREGIYLMLNTYYDHWLRAAEELQKYGYEKGAMAPQFQFIHPAGQKLWKRWVRRILTARNPYTGRVNADDPTIAIVQIVNEDNYFWYTFQPYSGIPAEVTHVLEDRFSDWLRQKYGSLEEARKAWGKGYSLVQGDDFAKGRVGLLRAQALRRPGKCPQRTFDTVEFLTEDLRGVFGGFQTYLKKDLGFRGLVNAGNWLSTDPRVLGPLDKHANAVCDVMDRHGVGWYKGPVSQAKTWTYTVGDTYQDLSPLRDPEGTPLTDTQYAGKVHVISEPKSPMPNHLRTDWIPFMAVYSSIQGTDAVTHFAGEHYWASKYRRWSIDTPAHLCQAPATALIFRNRYVSEGPTVVDEVLKLGDLYQLKGAAAAGVVGMDEMTEANIPSGGRASVDRIGTLDPLAYYVGLVQRTITERGGKSEIADLKRYIDRDAKIIRSANGQAIWDWGIGCLTLDAPCAQGVVGYLREAGVKALGDVTIRGGNEYGSVLVVSMDKQPLTNSRKVLVQVMSQDRNFGYRTRPVRVTDEKRGEIDVLEIVDTGQAPILFRKLSGHVTLRRSDADSLKVTALDAGGYPLRELPSGAAGEVRVDFLPDCFYYVIQAP